MLKDELFHSATNLARELTAGEVTSVKLTEEALSRAAAHGDPGIFITLTAETALEEAVSSDKRRSQGKPLSSWDGIPMAWKDLFDIAGTTTTAGSKVYKDAEPAGSDAKAVANCRAAGLVSIGKTNLSEFAYSGLGLNPHYGTPVNPRSDSEPRVPGGSSSGSAAAVAAGIVPIAIGTDTAGSVRVPASFCGIFGFKSSQNHYDRTGVFPLSASLDSIGTFANNIEDLAGLDLILRGQSPAQMPIGEGVINLVVPENVVLQGLEEQVASVFEKSIERLKAIGCSVVTKHVPAFDRAVELAKKHGTLTGAEAATLHKKLLASTEADQMDQLVRKRMLGALDFSAQDYIKLQWERSRLQTEIQEFLGGDLLYFPTVAIPAPSIKALQEDEGLFVRANLLALRNTIIGSYLGMPGINIPVGETETHLPVGGLLSAGHGDDESLLHASLALLQKLKETGPAAA